MLEAQVIRSGNLISVRPPFAELLGPELTYKRREQQGGDPTDVVYTPIQLYQADEKELVAPAGLTTRVMRKLKLANINATFQDLRTLKLADPDFSRLDKLRPEQVEILSKILGHDWMVIEAPTGSGKSFLIIQLCKLWPEDKILICCPFSSVLNQTYDDLKAAFVVNEVGMVGLGHKETECRITLSTDKSLHKCDLDNVRLFIFDECHRAGAEKSASIIGTIRNAKHIGFSASPYGRSDGGDLETEALFGPCTCKISYEEVQASGSVVPIEVRMVKCDKLEPYEVVDKGSLERRCLWRHAGRNELVANAVNSMLEELGDVQTLITVKTVEHAVNLHKWLPDFELVYASMDNDRMLSWIGRDLLPKNYVPLNAERRNEMQRAFRNGTLRKVIATGVWGTGANFPQLTLLVRADAQSGSIANTQLPGRVTRSISGKELGYILDFDDTFNSILTRRALQRKRDYSKKGWSVSVVD